MHDRTQEGLSGFDMPLARLLAINLGIGVAVAVLLVGGLLVLNPGGLRDLIFADRSPFVPIGLLLGGFIVTLGSTAMGTAIMAMGVGEQDDGPRGGLRVVKQRARKAAVER
jgi:acyl-coenzyme A thioesterase PaaI-like protein